MHRIVPLAKCCVSASLPRLLRALAQTQAALGSRGNTVSVGMATTSASFSSSRLFMLHLSREMFFFFIPHFVVAVVVHTPWDLSFPARDRTCTFCIEVHSLNP